MWVPLPGLTSPPEGRINTAYHYGELYQVPGGGPGELEAVMANTFGLRIDRYVVVSFSAFEQGIDTIGGVDINIPNPIHDEHYPMREGTGTIAIDFPAGQVHMDGATALIYARTRHDSSDFQRMRRQQQVLYAVRNKLLSPGTLPQLPALAQLLVSSARTDLSFEDLALLGCLAPQIGDAIQSWVIDASMVTGTRLADGAQVLLPRMDAILPVSGTVQPGRVRAGGMKRILPYMALGALQVFFLTTAFLIGYLAYARTADGGPNVVAALSGGDYPILTQVRTLLGAHFIGNLPDDKSLEYGAARGLVGAVGDPYTVFVEPQAHELETQSLQGEYGGIGVGLARNDKGELILSPYLDSPAAKAGVQDGDVLLAVDSVDIAGDTSLDQVTALIRGAIGTSVQLTLKRGGQEVTIAITRDRIELPSVTWKIVDGYPTIGLIAISRFQ